MTALRCVTCRNTYEAEVDIHSRLAQFDDYCICRDCVRFYQKTSGPRAGAHKENHATGQDKSRP